MKRLLLNPESVTSNPRRGFTLVEMLVVIAIIAVLASLSAGVYFRVLNSQQAANTAAALTRVQKALSTQYGVVLKEALREPLPPPASNTQLHNAYNFVLSTYANNDPKIARVVWVKLRLRQAFPVDFDEAVNLNGQYYPFNSLYYQKLNSLGITGSSSPPGDFESSACLLLALQRSVSGGVPVDEISKLSTQPFTVGNATIPALVDTYNQPLAFCRWPVGYYFLNPVGPQAGLNDPEDPQGLLSGQQYLGVSNQGSGWERFQQDIHQIQADSKNAKAGLSYKLQPVVVSPGPDKNLGLDPMTFATLSDAANDNITATANP